MSFCFPVSDSRCHCQIAVSVCDAKSQLLTKHRGLHDDHQLLLLRDDDDDDDFKGPFALPRPCRPKRARRPVRRRLRRARRPLHQRRGGRVSRSDFIVFSFSSHQVFLLLRQEPSSCRKRRSGSWDRRICATRTRTPTCPWTSGRTRPLCSARPTMTCQPWPRARARWRTMQRASRWGGWGPSGSWASRWGWTAAIHSWRGCESAQTRRGRICGTLRATKARQRARAARAAVQRRVR
jgi:hypothetical protein